MSSRRGVKHERESSAACEDDASHACAPVAVAVSRARVSQAKRARKGDDFDEAALRALPNVGPKVAADLLALGVRLPVDLAKRCVRARESLILSLIAMCRAELRACPRDGPAPEMWNAVCVFPNCGATVAGAAVRVKGPERSLRDRCALCSDPDELYAACERNAGAHVDRHGAPARLPGAPPHAPVSPGACSTCFGASSGTRATRRARARTRRFWTARART